MRPVQGEGGPAQGVGRDLGGVRARRADRGDHLAAGQRAASRVTIRGGVKAFLPGSQVDLRPVRNLDAFIGEKFQFKVIKFNKKRGNIVLSRRVLLEKERAALKESTLERLKEGQVVEGIVKNLTEYGAFIDLGGIDGLLHITDMSWGRVNHPSPSCSRSAITFASRCSSSTPRPSACPWASSRSARTRGARRTRSTSPARWSAARWSRSRTTARSSSSKRASRAWFTSPRCRGPVGSSTRPRWSRVGDMVEAVVLDVDVKPTTASRWA